MSPRDPHDPRDPRDPLPFVPRPNARDTGPRFEDEHTSYNHDLELLRDSGNALPGEGVLEHVRRLGFRQGEGEVSRLWEEFKAHQEAEHNWRRDVDRKLDKAIDGIERIEKDAEKARGSAKEETTEVRTMVFQHEQWFQQAKGAAFAGKFVWVLIGGLVSALVWLYAHLSTPQSAAASKPLEQVYPQRFPSYEMTSVPAYSAPSSVKVSAPGSSAK